jgi:hypothetical protein
MVDRTITRNQTYEGGVTGLIAFLASVAALAGLLRPALYRDAPLIVPQLLGQDLVTLAAGVPLVVAGAWLDARGSLRGRLLWLGGLGYLVYTYGTYALGARWNELFLVYVAVFGLSVYAFTFGMVRTDAARVRHELSSGAPVRSAATFLIVTAVFFALLWTMENVRALIAGTVPQTLIDGELPTNIIHVFDLAVVLPALVIGGIWLLRDRAWGYVLTGVLLVKVATLGLAVTAMGVFVLRSGMAAPLLPFFVVLTLGSLALCWRFLRARSPVTVAIRPGIRTMGQ